MIAQYLVKKKQYKLFAETKQDAKRARKRIKQLHGARITHVLQARPDLVRLNMLYDWDGICESFS